MNKYVSLLAALRLFNSASAAASAQGLRRLSQSRATPACV